MKDLIFLKESFGHFHASLPLQAYLKLEFCSKYMTQKLFHPSIATASGFLLSLFESVEAVLARRLISNSI
jgi:hypothetical protein